MKVLICGMPKLGVACRRCSPSIVPQSLPGGSSRNYNMGKTLTHEMGHTFGLPHTFSGGCGASGDGFADTNPEESPHHGCSDRHTCGSQDPLHNYLDYSYDKCMCSFTAGQQARVVTFLNSYGFAPKVADEGPCSCCNPNRCCPGGGCSCNGVLNADFVEKYDALLANPQCLSQRLTAIGKNPSHYTNVPRIGGQCCSEQCFQVPRSQWNTHWPRLPYMKLDFSPC